MSKILKTMSFLFSVILVFFSPIQNLTQTGGNCCAECAMAMKKEDEIEVVSEEEYVADEEA